MLGKLLKHEFRAVGRTMLPVMAVLLVLAGLANISIRVLEHVTVDFAELVLGLFIVAFVIGMIAAAVMSVVVMIERFYKNLLKEEGYLMMTLPVNVHGLVWSKLIVSCVWFVITALIIYAVIGLTVANLASLDISDITKIFHNMPSLRELLDDLYRETGISGGRLAALCGELFVLVIVSALGACLHFYAAMSLGHCFANNKVLLSVVFFVAISFVFSLLTPLFGMEMIVTVDEVNTLNQALIGMKLLQKSVAYLLLYELFQGAVLYAATTLSLKKGLNLG